MECKFCNEKHPVDSMAVLKGAYWCAGCLMKKFDAASEIMLKEYSILKAEIAELKEASEQREEERKRLRDALEVQQLCSDMVHEGECPLPDDPRYVKFIGEYDGYSAPEQRFNEFNNCRRVLRKTALGLDEH